MDEPAKSASPTAVGARIRALRTERGLSLSRLAADAGIGKATLSGLEAGTRNARLETLYAVAAQLGVPLGALLAGPGSSDPAPSVAGDAVTGTLLRSFADPGMTTELYRLDVRPGAVQSSPAHPRGTAEHLLVFRGTLRVGPPGAEVEVAAGGFVALATDRPHTYAAVGDEPVEAALVIRQPT
ncbi:helix-turn-helix domain-containing protein [Motilibacter deserti]|uniref:Helix-turn-helix domain-containing protein n=1 Tax=Motilibacter deserti TaxID=2714956 RepID=A0ABX0GR66_9ACTN|nr:XRE family transcriptional regulator [Motilibacter deserti]NHC12256.1 helix-turn-helix domain-containing protein [Motilibacter deserti]